MQWNGRIDFDAFPTTPHLEPTTDWQIPNRKYLTDRWSETHEPTGFVNREHSKMSFVDGTRTFTIEPSSPATEFVFYVDGTQ